MSIKENSFPAMYFCCPKMPSYTSSFAERSFRLSFKISGTGSSPWYLFGAGERMLAGRICLDRREVYSLAIE